MSARPLLALAVGAALGAGSAGCGTDDDGDACDGHACPVPASREALIEALEGHGDAVATYLRGAAASDGTIGRDWNEVLGGIATALDCDTQRMRSFVVLSNLGLAPKGIVTHCSDEPVASSRFFAVFEPDHARGDLDAERFRMVGWDAEAGVYRRYQVVPRHDALGVSVEPAFCTTCHGGRFGRETWVPIMNEMTNPWAQWNAEPGFRSFAFDEHFDASMAGEVFDEVAAPGRLDSAARLEPIVRAGIDRVTAVDVSRRSEAADVEVALELVRPIFCDETVNYVSEVHRSGEIRLAALIDPGLRRAMMALDSGDAAWGWLRDDSVHLPPPQAEEPALALVTVRGEATVQAEAALVSRHVLTPMQVLRVRALDWTQPVASTFRCDLFEAGQVRVRERFSDVDGYADTATLVPHVLDMLLQLPTEVGLIPLSTGDENTLVAIADASGPQIGLISTTGDLTPLTMSVEQLGEAIDAHLTAWLQAPDARARLDAERVRRACAARGRDPTAPLVEGAEACP